MISIDINDDKAAISSPYNPDFVEGIKKMGGRWDPAGKTWNIDKRNLEAARALLRDVYGMDDSPVELVSVRVTAKKDLVGHREPIILFGRVVAAARGRDTGARLGDGVAVTHGDATSGGSMKNWKTIIEEGTELIIHDLPKSAVSAELDIDLDDIDYEIIAPEGDDRKAQLEKEKEQLLARIQEIEAELAELL
jgi:hypothetical protein